MTSGQGLQSRAGRTLMPVRIRDWHRAPFISIVSRGLLCGRTSPPTSEVLRMRAGLIVSSFLLGVVVGAVPASSHHSNVAYDTASASL